MQRRDQFWRMRCSSGACAGGPWLRAAGQAADAHGHGGRAAAHGCSRAAPAGQQQAARRRARSLPHTPRAPSVPWSCGAGCRRSACGTGGRSARAPAAPPPPCQALRPARRPTHRAASPCPPRCRCWARGGGGGGTRRRWAGNKLRERAPLPDSSAQHPAGRAHRFEASRSPPEHWRATAGPCCASHSASPPSRVSWRLLKRRDGTRFSRRAASKKACGSGMPRRIQMPRMAVKVASTKGMRQPHTVMSSAAPEGPGRQGQGRGRGSDGAAAAGSQHTARQLHWNAPECAHRKRCRPAAP